MLEFKKSESIKNIATKLLKIQEEGVTVSKSSVNPFFRSKYASLGEHLDNILPLATKHGLSISQLPSGDSLCTLLIDTDSGEWLEAYYPLISTGKTPQEYLSQQTYARRGSLSAIFNVNALDDDGNSASGNDTKTESKAPVKGFIKSTEPNESTEVKPKPKTKAFLTPSSANFEQLKSDLKSGKLTMEDISNDYTMVPATKNALLA